MAWIATCAAYGWLATCVAGQGHGRICACTLGPKARYPSVLSRAGCHRHGAAANAADESCGPNCTARSVRTGVSPCILFASARRLAPKGARVQALATQGRQAEPCGSARGLAGNAHCAQLKWRPRVLGYCPLRASLPCSPRPLICCVATNGFVRGAKKAE